MLLHRYHNIEYFLSLDLETGLALVLKAAEKERDARIFAQWTAQLPIMALDGKAIGFEEYKNQVTGANIDRRPAAEILAEIDALENQYFREGEKSGA